MHHRDTAQHATQLLVTIVSVRVCVYSLAAPKAGLASAHRHDEQFLLAVVLLI